MRSEREEPIRGHDRPVIIRASGCVLGIFTQPLLKTRSLRVDINRPKKHCRLRTMSVSGECLDSANVPMLNASSDSLAAA